jgi:hypothetical protein
MKLVHDLEPTPYLGRNSLGMRLCAGNSAQNQKVSTISWFLNPRLSRNYIMEMQHASAFVIIAFLKPYLEEVDANV